MRKLSREQISGIEEAFLKGDIFPYASFDGLRSLTPSRTAESLARRGLMRVFGRGQMRSFCLTEEGRSVAMRIVKPREPVSDPLPDYDFSEK